MQDGSAVLADPEQFRTGRGHLCGYGTSTSARPLSPARCTTGPAKLPFEVLTARATRAQVGGDPRVSLLGVRLGASGHQVDVDVEHVQGLGASHIARIGPQETIQC
jgi:hypothetical protein